MIVPPAGSGGRSLNAVARRALLSAIATRTGWLDLDARWRAGPCRSAEARDCLAAIQDLAALCVAGETDAALVALCAMLLSDA